MNKKHILLSIIFILFLLNVDLVISSSIEASSIFFNKVFVSVFPFIILINILVYFDYNVFLDSIFGRFFSFIFNINKSSSSLLIISILTGCPSNAVYLNSMLDKNVVSEEEANRLLTFCFFPSIPFVIGSVGYGIYGSVKIGVLLYFIIFINNLLIGLFFRSNKSNEILIEIENHKESFSLEIKNAIFKAINTSIIILGNLIIFTVISNLIYKYTNISIISLLLEMTSGIFKVNNLNISHHLKLYLTCFALSFGGLSIYFQCTSVLSNYKIKIKKILLIRLIFSLLSSLLVFVLF